MKEREGVCVCKGGRVKYWESVCKKERERETKKQKTSMRLISQQKKSKKSQRIFNDVLLAFALKDLCKVELKLNEISVQQFFAK